MRCPCGSGETYDECCGRFHSRSAVAPTAPALMASRFSAFAVGDEAYLRQTWHRSTRPARIDLDGSVRWRRLEIVDVVSGGPFDDSGVVEFTAFYTSAEGRAQLHERSRFVREAGQWFYVDGVVR